ncbi:MAG: CRP/FNR family transcriptional regulator [Cycloclasticus pugetii]|jgi:CRP/FNR family transcriptional regulator|uniref:helix-turn-helix domain-containing protein n=1 Tax=Cycloclasticus pugetii TaxID=34068 RepID=UPI00240947EF|nr:helix-turn-helix domain-containing protein [Cycloclasticus pugetii]MDF1830236.1 helix-turn-helix domain-containing protein [Cycloclasticus pugetii]
MSVSAKNLFRDLTVSCSNCSLGDLCIPHGLAPQDIDRLDDSVSHTKLLQAGDILYHQNSPFKSLYALKSGSVKIISKSDESDDVMGVYLPGEIIGFDGVATDRYQCSIHALETSNICEIDLESLQENIPSIFKQLLKHASKSINQSNNTNATSKVSAEKRIVSLLLDLSDRYRLRGYFYTEFNLFLSRSEIGSLLNLSPETVSRGIRKLERDNLITLENRRRIKINNLEGLKNLLTAI